jgi:hypothetical protein
MRTLPCAAVEVVQREQPWGGGASTVRVLMGACFKFPWSLSPHTVAMTMHFGTSINMYLLTGVAAVMLYTQIWNLA